MRTCYWCKNPIQGGQVICAITDFRTLEQMGLGPEDPIPIFHHTEDCCPMWGHDIGTRNPSLSTV